jgi:MFS family permease
LVAVRFALPRLPPSAVREAVAGSPGSTGRLAAIAALAFLAMFGLGAFEVGVTVFADRRLAFTPAALALVFAACSVAMLIVQGLLAVGPRLHPRSAGLLVAGGFAAMGVGFALLALGGAPARLFAAVMLVGAGSGVLLPLLANLAVDRARAGIGATLGVQIAAASFGQGAGSAAGGWLFGAVAEASFWLYALLMAAAAAGVVATRFGSAGDATAGAVRSETEAHP